MQRIVDDSTRHTSYWRTEGFSEIFFKSLISTTLSFPDVEVFEIIFRDEAYRIAYWAFIKHYFTDSDETSTL